MCKKYTFVENLTPMDLILKYFPNLTEDQIDKFKKLETLYQDWNLKINVVSRKDIDELYFTSAFKSYKLSYT